MTPGAGALSVAEVPTDRVVRIAGASSEQLAVALHPLPPDAPVVIRQRLSDAGTVSAAVESVLDHLDAIARELFPAWLPAADVLDAAGDHDRRVVRMLAHRRAAVSDHFGPFLAAVAEAALRGQPSAVHFAADIRARGLARILADAYQRDAVVLLVESSVERRQNAAAALEWLSHYGGFGVWLTAGALPGVDRFPTVTLDAPPSAAGLAAPAAGPATDFPAPIGRPHPGSLAEQTLERWLTRYDWAVGREWNQVRSGHPLVPLIRVDLLWPAQRCVVEIDGPDHRGALKYADDRRRDNALTLDGFAVLRFTNEEVLDDPARVLGTIETLLRSRPQEGDRP